MASSAGSLPRLDFLRAAARLAPIVRRTPLELNATLSARYDAQVYLKREDLQLTRSYKLRGAYNKMSALTEDERRRGVATASAGNHAQGLAYSAARLGLQGVIFMPTTTPRQKVAATKVRGMATGWRG